MRIIFMGTPEFAIPSLEAISKDVVAIFTKTDKPNRRGGKIKFTPVKEFGLNNNIPVYQPKSVKDIQTIELIKSLKPDLIVVVAYGKILPQEIIDICPIINVHSSLLPKYRGAAPINMAIINGEEKSGVSVMYIVEDLDAGDVITTLETPILESDTFGTLHDRLKNLGAQALINAIKIMDKEVATPQDENLVSFVKPFKKNDLEVDWNKSEKEVFNFVRGLSPTPTAWTRCNGKLFKIYGVEKYSKKYDGQCGQIVDKIKKRGFVVKVNDGSVILTSVKPENKKLLSGVDLMNGNLLKIGDKFE